MNTTAMKEFAIKHETVLEELSEVLANHGLSSNDGEMLLFYLAGMSRGNSGAASAATDLMNFYLFGWQLGSWARSKEKRLD